MKRRPRTTGRKQKRPPSDCVIPPAIPTPALGSLLFKQTPYDADEVREYVEIEAKEPITHLEKVATESMPDRKLEAWDVHTETERYWVITNPTNLYSQKLFPSLDYTITFHVGLVLRTTMRREATDDEEQSERLAAAWRRWTQAAEALDSADEAEEIQAVGMRCRECLLAMVRAIAMDEMIPRGQQAPKQGDFKAWADVIANAIAPGSSAKEIRGHLKALAISTWELVSWLTHAANATRQDGEMALEATQSTLAAFCRAVLRRERGAPERCPACSSYRIASVYVPGTTGYAYRPLCESCGWTQVPRRDRRAARGGRRRAE